jgi:hypothetical protein
MSKHELDKLTPMQLEFLRRMQHQVKQRSRYAHIMAVDDWRTKLIARALYSSYRDLSRMDLEAEARQLLEHGRITFEVPTSESKN